MAMVPVGEISKMTNGHRAAADLDVTDRPFPIAHATQEVRNMVIALVKADGLIIERFVADALGRRFKFAAVDQNFALGPNKQNAAAVAVQHLDAVGIKVAESSCRF